jgi:hypothetical protein
MRAVIAILLTLVAASSAHVTRALACDGGASACCCSAGHEDDAHADHAQRIAPICGCTIESAPEHLPPPLNGVVTSAPARMALAPLVACVALEWPLGPDGQLALDTHRSPARPCPTRSLLAQKTSLLV